MPEYTDRHVSIGSLPPAHVVAQLIAEAHRRFADVSDGLPSTVYPGLEGADPSLFGICVTSVTGPVHTARDCDTEFPTMSVARPFTFALVCDAIATVDAVAGQDRDARWATLRHGLSLFAGRELILDLETFESASATNQALRTSAGYDGGE